MLLEYADPSGCISPTRMMLADDWPRHRQGEPRRRKGPDRSPRRAGVSRRPRRPQINLLVGLLWAIWVGWIFSTVGAFGGIMAGVGHMTIYGLGTYAKTFKDTAAGIEQVYYRQHPGLQPVARRSVGTGFQFQLPQAEKTGTGPGHLSGGGRPFCHPDGGLYHRRQTQVFPIPGLVRFVVFVIGGFMIYEMSPKGQASKKAPRRPPRPSRRTVKSKGKIEDQGVKTLKWSLVKTEISFFGQNIHLQPDLGLRRRLLHFGPGLLSRHRRRISIRAVPDQRGRAAHVRRGAALRPCRC